jgi:hypothetical protein
MAAPGICIKSLMKYALRLTEAQHTQLQAHLFPGDRKEAVALLLCGRRNGEERHIFTVRKVVPVPHEVCDRRLDRVTWPTDAVDGLLRDASGTGQAIVMRLQRRAEFRRKFRAHFMKDDWKVFRYLQKSGLMAISMELLREFISYAGQRGIAQQFG